ncbi:MAG: HAD family hydrolase [Bacteroidales bacterium]|nr:HAD family hydrolase [Clostridium sp.]MCM1204494.1 HAD family hydrolase [Bacteroidales bacterium]
MKKKIIFDVDGVLIDSMPIWENSANLYLSAVHRIDAPPEVDKNCAAMSLLEAGTYIKELYPQIVLSAEQLADGVAEFIRERYWSVPEKKGMIKTIHLLEKQGYLLYLATASVRENVKGALANLGVWECFQDIYTCTEIGWSKNYTEYYEEVARRIGTPCKELVMVEDSLHSMITAKKAGLTVAAVYEEASADRTEEIRQVCDVYLHGLEELPQWLDAFFG